MMEQTQIGGGSGGGGCGGKWRGRSAIRLARKAGRAAVARSDESWSLLITADSFIISTYWTQGEFTNYFLWRAAGSLRVYVRSWWITFIVDFASTCFNPVRFDFHPSRIHVEPPIRPRFPNYWRIHCCEILLSWPATIVRGCDSSVLHNSKHLEHIHELMSPAVETSPGEKCRRAASDQVGLIAGCLRMRKEGTRRQNRLLWAGEARPSPAHFAEVCFCLWKEYMNITAGNTTGLSSTKLCFFVLFF